MFHEVLNFWFEELSPAQWWQKDDELDKSIKAKFSALHHQASQCELFEWRQTAQGRLAEIILLDQFSRNMYRDTPKSFAQDPLALALSQQAIQMGADKALTAVERSFLYMPFMHSESLLIHQQACQLYKDNGIDSNYQFELKHLAIIERFGRYPHRNKILGRESTPAEITFLTQPGSSF
ncbi:MAG: DUF924 domain-containing protein [Colwellia sp.]|nr:DUF924 domain-containing protein [Colwellia sp.]MCW9081583.1 DUF924 domain-containing protein [Colwellia sp.]